MQISRRSLIQVGIGAGLAIASNLIGESLFAQNNEKPGKIQIGFWPIASGLPLFLAVKKGLFKEVGLDVEAVKFASPNQVAEALIAGRLQGTGSGMAIGALAIAEIASPNLFKIITSNASNVKNVLDQVVVAKNSPIKSMADLKGKKFATGPGAQNKAIAEEILAKNGITGGQILQLEVRQHIGALASGQIDAVYTLEPTGTVGASKGLTRILENGVVSKYILGDPNAPWFGGNASLSTKFISQFPQTTKTFIQAYRKAVVNVRNNPGEARQYMEGYTAIEGELTKKVPLASYTMFDEFKAADLQYLQAFLNFLERKGVLSRPLQVAPLIYKA